MGFALKELGSDQCLIIAANLFVVRENFQNKHELHGLCPIHGEKNPSFSYNYEKDLYHCLSCGVSGDLVDLWCKVKGCADPKEGFKEFCRTYDITSGTPRKPEVAPTRKGPDKKSSKKYDKKTLRIIQETIWEKMGYLPEDYLKRLQEERGWSKQTIEVYDLRLQTQYFDKKSDKIRPVNRAERIAIPVRDDKGLLINIRNYKPGAQRGKIMSWGEGYGSAALFPPGSSLRTDEIILLCEGEPDTICALSLGFNAITQTSKLVNWPDEHLKHFRNKEVVIAYDADKAGIQYAAKAAEQLIKVARSVRIITWPDFMGMQDDGNWPDNHGQDLTDYFVKYKKTPADLQDLIATTPFYSMPETEMDNPAGGGQFFKKVNGRWSFMSRWLAEQILADMSLMYDPKTGLLYKWNNRYWDRFYEDHVRKICLQYLGDESKISRVNDASAQAVLLASIPHGREPDDQTDWLCLQNCMLNISDLEQDNYVTKPLTKDFYATYALDVHLSDKLIGCPLWLQYLDEAVSTREVIMQIQEFFGYCLTRDTKFGKCLFLLGPGSDGKSTLLKTLRKMVNPRNCASVGFKKMDDQFYLSSLYNKLLNISTEIGSSAMETDFFKAIITGDPITAAFKNKDPFEFVPFCKVAFSGNRLPRVRDNSDGLFRRFLPVQFKKQFLGEEDDKDLEEKLEAELSGIFQWSLAGLRRLRRQKCFTQSPETESLMMEYKRFNNPILCFCEDCCELNAEFDEGKADLYKEYSRYCDRNGYSRANNATFFRELYSVKTSLKQKRAQVNGRREQRVTGIALKPKLEVQK